MARFPRWLITCPMTGSSCSRSEFVEKAHRDKDARACSESRPVSKGHFGAESSMTESRGSSRPPGREHHLLDDVDQLIATGSNQSAQVDCRALPARWGSASASPATTGTTLVDDRDHH